MPLERRPHLAPVLDALEHALAQRAEPQVERRVGEHCGADVGEVVEPVGKVQPRELDRARKREGRGEPEGERERGPARRRVAGHVVAAPVGEQQREQGDAGRGLLDVETLCEVGGRGEDDERDRELPGAAAAAREPAREPDEREPEGDRREPCCMRHARGSGCLHERGPVGHLGRERRDDADDADAGGRPGDRSLRPRAPQLR